MIGLQVRGYVSQLSEAFHLLEEGPTMCPPESTFCPFCAVLPFRLQKPLKLPKFRLYVTDRYLVTELQVTRVFGSSYVFYLIVEGLTVCPFY